MKRFLLLGMVFLGAAFASAHAEQIYDNEGHLIAYQYPDGSIDRYTYDSSWRMVSFTGRDGKEVKYSYKSDGTMEVVTVPKAN
ncbi:MAG: YD repeat-containing protein [Terrimicrobiaceae bacterium]|nr:YD repeat-containing protein [Terrimicrobiaceae bacterium]